MYIGIRFVSRSWYHYYYVDLKISRHGHLRARISTNFKAVYKSRFLSDAVQQAFVLVMAHCNLCSIFEKPINMLMRLEIKGNGCHVLLSDASYDLGHTDLFGKSTSINFLPVIFFERIFSTFLLQNSFLIIHYKYQSYSFCRWLWYKRLFNPNGERQLEVHHFRERELEKI